MESKFENSISKVNYIINNLSTEDYNKIPQNVINFFDNNSSDIFTQSEVIGVKNVMENLNLIDLKFLKIVDYYINK